MKCFTNIFGPFSMHDECLGHRNKNKIQQQQCEDLHQNEVSLRKPMNDDNFYQMNGKKE